MKRILLSPFSAPVFFFVWILFWMTFPVFLPYQTLEPWAEETGIISITTYASYGIAFIAALMMRKCFDTRTLKVSYACFVFMLTCLLFREMGIQHWLTSTDSTAIKLRFFTNPNNPAGEKMVVAGLLLLVFGVVAFLAIRYLKYLITGVFKIETLPWTIGSLGVAGIVCKIADRIPGHYRKITQTWMAPEWKIYFTFLEETTEILLPLFIALAFIQYGLIKRETISAKR